MRRLLIVTFLCLSTFVNSNALNNKQTFLYSVKDTDSLYLDLYQVDSLQKSKGCVIFAFGGGFLKGARDVAIYMPLYEHLTQKGYAVVAIDYRLGLKKLQEKGASKIDFFNGVKTSIWMACEDMLDATNFVLDNASAWGIDKDKILIGGTSAGAITSLQTEYEICNRSELGKKLPETFNYAGVISLAGAVVSVGSAPHWDRPACPILLFHGDSDTFVPFEKIGALGQYLYGSNYIVRQIKSLNTPYYFCYFENYNHNQVATKGLVNFFRQIDYFLDFFVEEAKRFQITEKVEDMSLPEKPENYSIFDFYKTLSGQL